MSKLLRITDKIEIKIDSIRIKISPLSKRQKMALQSDMVKAANGDLNAAMDAVSNSIKYSLKEIHGVTVEDEEGNETPYKLSFEDNGDLTDECIDDLLNMEESNKINAICSSLIGGVPTGTIKDNNGNPMEGVSIIAKKKTKQGK